MKKKLIKKEIDILADCVDVERNEVFQWTLRTDNYGNYRNSATCKNCFDIISELKIKRIIFSTENEDFKIIKTQHYKTEHVSNGNRFLNMTDDEKKSRMQKKRQTSLSPTHIKYTK